MGKKCNRCLVFKPEHEFYSHPVSYDKLHPRCKECLRELAKIRHKRNRDSILCMQAEYRLKNKDYFRLKQQEWVNNNRDRYRDKGRKYMNNRLASDPIFKFKHCTRRLITMSFKKNGLKKSSKTEEILGCSIPFFKGYIQSMFKDGMNWSNHGRGNDKWHLDHIKPLKMANTFSEVVTLCHFSNFQPLWEEDNLRKSYKY